MPGLNRSPEPDRRQVLMCRLPPGRNSLFGQAHTIVHQLVYLLVRRLICVLKRLPLPESLRVCRSLGINPSSLSTSFDHFVVPRLCRRAWKNQDREPESRATRFFFTFGNVSF